MNLEARTAIEALRAGVPNRAAVRLMGIGDNGIEQAFDTLLQRTSDGGAAHPGLGVAGGFGTGKSHLLTYLAEVARTQNFVVSRVVISKETPLADPARVFEAAIRGAALPGRNEDAIGGALGLLRAAPERLEALEGAVSQKDAGLAPIFAALLFLLRKPSLPPELARRCERFLAGGRMTTAAFRQALAAVGAARIFELRLPPAAELTAQRIRFTSRLFQAAGYAGWCLLLDEVELIGRYSALQRAMAYARLAGWLGLQGAAKYPGIVAVYAITDDFVTAVVDHRQDDERLPERLRLKGRHQEALTALAAIRHIEDTVRLHRLPAPGAEELARAYVSLRKIYEAAYDWVTPALPVPERTATRTLRQYIKAWLTQWDLQRLTGVDVAIVEQQMGSDYREDEGLAAPRDEPDDDAG
jgi:hypothetical protein